MPQIIKVSPHFGVSVPYFHGRYSEGHFEVRAVSGRGSTKSERYLPTTNEKPSETMFQRVLLDFVLKTFGLGAENETRAHDVGVSRELYLHPPTPERGVLGSLVQSRVPSTKKGSQQTAFYSLSGKRDSNSRPQPWQGCALPTELFPHYLLNSATDITT